ncbi:MAG TPA: hypothetical protein VE344_05700 [Methylomirabilota bacterium]|nr:hypothetical protein [Methylomirabilota bacterium]
MEYAFILIAAAVGAYFGAYLRRKGQNFADKEDIKKLTEIVENIRSQHAKELENLVHENRKALEFGSREHQLRLAALDRRLEAYQQAFTLWRKLHFALYSDKMTSVVIECQNWWNSNCLYLDAQAREAFIRACTAANDHESLVKNLDNKIVTPEDIKRNGDIIRAAGVAIVQGAALPPIKDFDVEVGS